MDKEKDSVGNITNKYLIYHSLLSLLTVLLKKHLQILFLVIYCCTFVCKNKLIYKYDVIKWSVCHEKR